MSQSKGVGGNDETTFLSTSSDIFKVLDSRWVYGLFH